MDVSQETPQEQSLREVQEFAEALRRLAQAFEHVTTQVRNARMTDALELSPAELEIAYPEVDVFAAAEARDEPYAFWIQTRDANLTTRLEGALTTSHRLARELEEAQK